MKDEFFEFEDEDTQEDNSTQAQNNQPTQPTQAKTQITQNSQAHTQPTQSQNQNQKLVKVVFIRQLLPNVSRARRSKYSTEDSGDIVINQVIDKVQWKAIMSIRNHSLAWLHRNAVNTPWGWIYFSNDLNAVKEEKAMLLEQYTRIVREMGREARQDVLTAINRSLPYMEAYLTVEEARRIFNDVLAVETSKVKRITEKMRSGVTSRQYFKLLKKKEELEAIIGKIQELVKGL
jgi:hypothetical protein